MRDNRRMQVSEAPLGLRERKKIKTRRAIRREAFRLIEQNGYAATTVEQIAQAADVSPSTSGSACGCCGASWWFT